MQWYGIVIHFQEIDVFNMVCGQKWSLPTPQGLAKSFEKVVVLGMFCDTEGSDGMVFYWLPGFVEQDLTRAHGNPDCFVVCFVLEPCFFGNAKTGRMLGKYQFRKSSCRRFQLIFDAAQHDHVRAELVLGMRGCT